MNDPRHWDPKYARQWDDAIREAYEPALACQLDGRQHDFVWWKQFYAIPRGTIEVYAEGGTLLGEVRQDVETGRWTPYAKGQSLLLWGRPAYYEYWDEAADLLLDLWALGG